MPLCLCEASGQGSDAFFAIALTLSLSPSAFGAAFLYQTIRIAAAASPGVEPNVVSYNAAISACEKGGQWLAAVGLFEAMKRNGRASAQPDAVTYNALLSALATSHQVLLKFGVLESQASLYAGVCSPISFYCVRPSQTNNKMYCL